MLLSEEEAKIKAQLWFSENADYLKEQEGSLNVHMVSDTPTMHVFDMHFAVVRKERLAAQQAAKGDKPKKVRYSLCIPILLQL